MSFLLKNCGKETQTLQYELVLKLYTDNIKNIYFKYSNKKITTKKTPGEHVVAKEKVKTVQ